VFIATKLLTAKLHSLYVNLRSQESEILKKLELVILPLTAQPCL